MRTAANGTLFLTEEGKTEPTCFFIEGEPKRGGSCLVYSVRWQQAGTMFRGILKECYPSEWGNLPAIERKENGQLFIPEAWMEAYQSQLTKMRQAYELQMQISLQDHLVNRVVEERGIYYGCYGACYSLMAYADGVSYEQVRDSNLKQTLETLLSVARFLKIYHDAGYVHLDIKPENLLILPETRQLVKVLDYDSSVSLEELHTEMVRLSRSEQWEAPELAAFASGSGMTEREWMRKQRRIGIYTDQYPLGRILAKRLGIPEQLDHSIPKNWLWETNHPWLEEVRPCVREKLQQFFSHTLAIATQNRYPSDEALIAALEELVAVSDPTAIFLRSSYLEKKATFYGREDELKQMERLQKERKRIFLTGMGGIGKSELARTYAVEHRREYDTIILARYESTLEDVIRRVGIEHLVHFGGEGLPPEQYFALAKRKLKECCVEEKVLLILDNLDVDSDTGMQEFLEMGWDVIVTTRYHWEEYEDDCVFVKEFDEEGAFELFCRNYGKTKEEFNKEERLLILELIKLVEYHTMTVELLAKQTAKEEADFKTFLKELKEGIQHHDQTKIPHIKDGSYGKKSMYQHIAALFSIAKEKEKKWISETEEALLRHMTLISYQGIEGKQFLTWCGYPESDLPILKDLAAKGWIKQEQKQYAMHPIISEMLYAELQPSIENCNTLIHTIKQQLDEEEFSTLIWQEKEKRLEYGVFLAKRIKEESREAAYLYNTVGIRLSDRNRYQEALEYKEKALEICREVLGEKHAATASLYNNVGNSYWELGERKKGLEYQEKALEIRREVLGEKNADTAGSYNNVGIRYEDLGERKKGLEYQEKALEIRREVLGEKNADTAGSYNNVGNSYWELGERKKGLEYQEKALEIFKEILGEKHAATAISYNNVGIRYEDLGDRKKGLEYQEKALEIQKEILGEKNTATASLYHNVGNSYWELGERKKGLEYQEKALEIRREVLGEKHADTASSYNSVGISYEELGDRKKGLEYQEKALEIRREVLGEKHADTASSYNNVGISYEELGDRKKGLEYQEKALEIFKEVLGEKNAATAQSYHNVGISYWELGDRKKGLEYKEKALEIRKEILGEKHADTASSYNSVGISYWELGDRKKGLEYKEKALEIFKEVLGEKNADTASSYNNVGMSYWELGERKKGLEYKEKALEIFKEVLGEKNANTASSYHNVGNSYWELGDRKKGLEYKEKALEIFKEVLGEKNANTASSYNSVGISYEELGDRKKGLEYKEKALEIRRKVLGEKNAATAQSYNNVGISYWELGDRKKGLEYQEKALEIRRKVLGEKHAATAQSYNNVGISYWKLGERKKGLEYKEKALKIFKEVLGERNAATASSYHNVGISYEELGDRKKGLEYKEKALEIRKEILGEKNAATANSYNNVGISYWELGEAEKAIDYIKRALDIYTAVLGNEHPTTQKTLELLNLLESFQDRQSSQCRKQTVFQRFFSKLKKLRK